MMTTNMADRVDGEHLHPACPPVRRTLLAGAAVMILGLGGFATWSALAPLASAAIAPGVVRVDSNRKTVQHVDGGIIGELLVREGDQVAAGQVLVRLDELDSRSLFDLLEGQYLALLAQEARLVAERDRQDEVVFQPELEAARSRPEVAEILAGQVRIFTSMQTLMAGQTDVLTQRLAQLQAQIQALEAQLQAGARQLALIREETLTVQAMMAKGLERKPRYLALERETASLEGAQGDYKGRIAQAREAIIETRMQILNLQHERVEKAAAELREVQTRRAEIQERLAAARVQLVRREVLAPQAGTVLNLRYHTRGGVIEPGGPILDIVPDDERLVVEARVQPTDIDVVHAGLPAQVVLPAYKSRIMPKLDGQVLQVSADALTDERTGLPYYTARVELDAAELARLDGVKLYPGMPAEAVIVTGERTALEYLLQPIQDSFRHAWREQ